MLVGFSFYDILKIKEFEGLSQFDLLKREMDDVVAPYLFRIGGNIDKGIKIQACVHRTVDLQTVTGYRYVLLERNDKEWLANRNCSMSARIHAQTDPELASDMVRMSMQGTSESKFIEMCAKVAGKDGTVGSMKKDEDENWEENRSTMLALRSIQKDIRGYIHVDEDLFDDEDNPNVANFETQTKGDY